MDLRAVLRLSYFHGVRQAAVAEVMNLTPSQVAHLLAQGLQRLAVLIERSVDDRIGLSDRLDATGAA